MRELTKSEIEILNRHAKWLSGEGGECANLRGADLHGANLHGADLHGSLKEASAGLRRLPADLAQALGAADIHAAAREGLK